MTVYFEYLTRLEYWSCANIDIIKCISKYLFYLKYINKKDLLKLFFKQNRKEEKTDH